MMRRIALALFFSMAFVLAALPAWAGSYLDRTALLLDQARKEGDMLQPRTHDKELVMVVKAMAETRLRVGRKMEIPAAVAKAHPHFLLVLANYEQAAEAAEKGNFKKFVEHLYAARNEERAFRVILRDLGYSLPNMNPKRTK